SAQPGRRPRGRRGPRPRAPANRRRSSEPLRRYEGEDQKAEQQNGDDQPEDVIAAHATRRSCSAVPAVRSAKASSSDPIIRSQAATNRATTKKNASRVARKTRSAMDA